jgi:carbon-monoxide dehydrogenase medium subunit
MQPKHAAEPIRVAMKPASFEYHAPGTLAAALALLGEHGETAKILAGGQSLLPAMNFRLVRPDRLVDINRIRDFPSLRAEAGRLSIGALTRHAALERPVVPGPLGAFLPRVARHIAHVPIRTRGTFCGSLAHADPASEWCALAVTLQAEIVARSAKGERTIPAGDFFRTLFTTALHPDELITEVRLPLLSDDWRLGFVEFSRRAGDYAIVLAIVAVRIVGGRIAEARVGLGGVGGKPMRSSRAEALLVGRPLDAGVMRAAAEAAKAEAEPLDDVQAPADYKRDLATDMVRRALEQAAS